MSTSLSRTRWAAVGAAVTIALGGGGLGIANAVQSSGERATFVPISPCRLLDTRAAYEVPGRQTPLGADDVHTQDAHGTNGECTDIPADATALALNVTALNATDITHLTLWPASEPQPNASHLNPVPGQPPTPNAANVDLSVDGQFKIFNLHGTVDVVADITGYYVDHNHDDRYYTEDEVDVRSKWISIDPLAVHRTAGDVVTGNGASAGLSLPDGADQQFEFGFSLPPDYTPDTAIRFEFLWHTASGPCGIELRANFSSISRESQVAVGGSPYLGYRAPDGTPTATASNQSVRTTFELRPESFGLEPGDGILVGFFRDGDLGTDTCTTPQLITGIRVIYE